MAFYCREDELYKMNRRFDGDKFECVVIYGRRRVGKTALINEFCIINHKVIFDYLFKSSYMPVQPIVTGFSGIFHCGRYSQIFLYPRMFLCSKVVCGVVNSPFTTYAISRFISVIDVSEVVCA